MAVCFAGKLPLLPSEFSLLAAEVLLFPSKSPLLSRNQSLLAPDFALQPSDLTL